MKPEHVGAIVARGCGVVFLGWGIFTGMAVPFDTFGSSASGWTSYSPMAGAGNASNLVLHDTYYLLSSVILPASASLLAGAVLILFSRRIGRWLAHGIRDDD